MFIEVTPEEWKRAKAILAEQQEAAKKAGSSLADMPLKISRKKDPDNILQHSFHYIQGKLVAGDRKWLGKGGSGKAKYAIDENGTLYILRFQSKERPQYQATTSRILSKLGGLYFAYTRTLTQEQDFFKKALRGNNDTEIQSRVKHIELFQAIGDTNIHDFLHNKNIKLSPDQHIVLAIQSALALYDFHTVLREIHRDFKPSNMIINTKALATNPFDFRVSLIDWDFSSERPFGNDYLVDGRPIGTTGYLSPEVCAGVASPVGDIFALGVTLTELILRSQVKFSKLSEDTIDLIYDTTNTDPNERPSIPDLVRALWRELSSAARDDYSNEVIGLLHKRIQDLPPPLSPEEKEQSKIIDTPEALFARVAIELWSTLDHIEKTEVLTKPFQNQWRNKLSPSNVIELLDSLDEDIQVEIIQSCSVRMKNFIMENSKLPDIALEDLIKNLEHAIVLLSAEVAKTRKDHSVVKAFLREVAPLMRRKDVASLPSLEAIIAQLNSTWKTLEALPEYRNDKSVKTRYQTLVNLWSALPESHRLDITYSNLFSFLRTVSETIPSEKLQADEIVRQTGAFKGEVAINQLFSAVHQIAQRSDETDPFGKHVQILFDNVYEKNKTRRPSPQDLIQGLRGLCSTAALYEPEVSKGLLALIEQVTGNYDLALEQPKNLQAMMNEVLGILEIRYNEGVAYYETEQTRARVGHRS